MTAPVPRRQTEPLVHPLEGALGAEITGVDLSSSPGEEAVAFIRRALLDHLVVFFRDQDLTPAGLVRLASAFGTPMPYPMIQGLPEEPLVIEVLKRENDAINFGGLWHSDTTYLERPPMGSLLYALEVPPRGGDTLFANGYLAYESLSDGMRSLLEGLRAINRSDVSSAVATRPPDGGAPTAFEALHPVVRTHPETARKSLYVNPAHTTRFESMTEEESAPLLRWLFALQSRAEFTCRFRWQAGSLAFWDNRVALHYPLNDYAGHRRRMLRIQVEGPRPV